jgi:hypothetical protein
MYRLLSYAIVLIFIFFCIQTSAQERDKKGYVSLNAGPTFKLSGNQHPSGLQLHVELGYEIWNGLGVVGTWTGGAYAFQDQYYFFNGSQWTPVPVNVQLGYGMLMVGPMYVVRFDKRSSLDIKARLGRYFYEDVAKGSNLSANNTNTSLGYQFSGSYQYRFAKWWSCFASIDYGTNRADFNFESYGSMSTIAVTVGVGLRL